MSRVAAKFGGTSLASAEQIRKVAAIVDKDPRRQVVVVSAPGKRVKTEPKVTDLLYLCAEMAAMGTEYSGPFETISNRFLEIERELGVTSGVRESLEAFQRDLSQGVTTDYVASRGEYWNALIIAKFLNAVLIDPLECVSIAKNGLVEPQTYEALGRLLVPGHRYVVPGFYGRGPDGKVKTFSRGGSDISGAIAARAISASVYENWTDVSGFLMADPRIVEGPRPMVEVTYRELRELSYMGASVLHDEATLPVREVGIPIQIKNTNEPTHPGTRIVSKLSPEEDKATAIAGIAGRDNFSMICIEKSLMNKEVGFTYRALGILERRGISIEHLPSSIDGLNIIVESKALEGQTDEVVSELQALLSPDKITVVPQLGLIAVVGEGMSQTIGVSARVFGALARANVNVRVINQGASEVNIIVGVVPSDFKVAISALYTEFVSA
jgi:aspartate kinase